MVENFIQLGDTKIEISDETAKNLGEQFCKKSDIVNADLVIIGTCDIAKRLIIIPFDKKEVNLICNSLKTTGRVAITPTGTASTNVPLTQEYIEKNYTKIRNIFSD